MAHRSHAVDPLDGAITAHSGSSSPLSAGLDVAAIVEGIDGMFSAVDRQWRYTYLNSRCSAIAPLPLEQMVGRTIWECYPEIVGTESERHLRRAMEERLGVRFATTRDDGETSFDVALYPSENGIVIFVTDTTEQRRTERALAANQERLRIAVEAAEMGPWEFNIRTGAVHWSDNLQKIHGLVPGTFGGTFEDYKKDVHPDDLDYVLSTIGATIEHGGDHAIEYRIRRPDGEIRWVQGKGRVLFGEDGAPERVVGVCMDITDRKEADRAREHLLEAEQKARNDAERVSRLKDEFLATLSHELRTPLSAILGWSQLLAGGGAGGAEGAELRQGLEAIERNARVQTQIIEDLLDMSRIVSGKLRLDVQRIDLIPVIEAAIETVRPAADAKEIQIRSILDPRCGPVAGDPARLQQIVWNLLNNAVKFTGKGGRVELLLERVNSHLEITVSDNGRGISPDFLPHVFDRFRQADSSTTREHGGLGIGLSLVRQLVEIHGGTVRAKSPGEGMGATFIVALPITAVQFERPEERRHPERSEGGANEEIPAPDLEGVRVLAVDDDPDARELIKRVLEGYGATVMTAESAGEGFELLCRERPDVLLSDIGMPKEDGYSFIRRIRALPVEEGGATPAVSFTAFARSEDRTRSLMSGFQIHVAKPIQPIELGVVVANLAGRTGR